MDTAAPDAHRRQCWDRLSLGLAGRAAAQAYSVPRVAPQLLARSSEHKQHYTMLLNVEGVCLVQATNCGKQACSAYNVAVVPHAVEEKRREMCV